MKEYSVVAVLWEDHQSCSRMPIMKDPQSIIIPTLSVGVVVSETDKLLTLASTIERHEDRDEADYMLIIKSTISSIKEFGKIPVNKLRKK